MANQVKTDKKALLEFMSAFDDPKLPDGAWQQMLEDSVDNFNQANNTNYDPYDSFITYIHNRNK